MSSISRLIKNSIYLYISQGLNFVLPLIVLPYLLTTLSISSFGIYSFAFAFSQFCLLFVDFGFNISATKKIVEEENRDNLIDYFWTIIFIKLLFFTFIVIIGLIVLLNVPAFALYKDAVLCSFLMVLGSVFMPLWWFQGLSKFRVLTIVSIFSKIFTYPLIFFYVVDEGNYLQAILIQSSSYILAAVLSFLYLFKYQRDYFSRMSFTLIKSKFMKEVADSWPIFLSNSSISLYTNTIVLILGSAGTSYNVGVFSAVDRIIRVISSAILIPLNQACFPFLIKLKSENIAKTKKVFKGILFFVCLSLMFVCAVYFLFRDVFIFHFFKEYVDKIYLLDILIFSLFPIAIGGVFGQLGLLALGGKIEKKIFSKIYMYIGLASLPISFLLIYSYLEVGAFISIAFVEIIVCTLMVFFTLKRKII